MATASVLGQALPRLGAPQDRARLAAGGSSLSEVKLRELVTGSGVGYHHAGLSQADRKLVEELFGRGLLPVLACTSTLALGVNLPAHLVVIKGTEQYSGGQMREYSESAILQMSGRAGRVQFGDKEATVVIMTKEENRGGTSASWRAAGSSSHVCWSTCTSI